MSKQLTSAASTLNLWGTSEKGSDPNSRNGPQAASHDWGLTPVRGTVFALIFLLLVAGLSGCGSRSVPGEAKTEQLDHAAAMKLASQEGRWEEARQFGLQALIASPNDPELLTETAVATAMCGMKHEAASMLADAVKANDYSPPTRVTQAVQAYIDVGEIYPAIELLQRTLDARPGDRQHRRMLVQMLAEVERGDLLQPHYQMVIRDRQFDKPLLVGLTDMSTRRFSPDTAQRLMQRNPDDYRVRLGEAQALIDQRDANAAETVLREILDRHPDFAPAHAMLGQVLVLQGRISEIVAWANSQCTDSTDQCNYWLTLGDWAMESGQHVEAARAYWEATLRDVNSVKAWSRLADTLRLLRSDPSLQSDTESGEASIAEAIRDASRDLVLQDADRRINILLDLRKHLEEFAGSDEKSQRIALEIAKSLRQLGRCWEAEAWSAVATTLVEAPAAELNEVRNQIVAALRNDRQWVSKQGQPSLAINLSSLPAPHPNAGQAGYREDTVAVLPTSDEISGLHIADETESRNMLLPHSIDHRDELIIHSMGAGGGAIDYDLDGWTDCLFAAAGGSMGKKDSAPNVLLRNLEGVFRDVTSASGSGDRGFAQGVVVGDFNEDGLPDYLVGNLGENLLRRNNGDGTFTDVTDLLTGDAKQWTTCGAFVDLNDDGISDLVTVNYCDADAPIDQPCYGKQTDQRVPCHPVDFPAHADQLFHGSTDGRFHDMSSQWLPKAASGRGLGIVAGTLDGRQTAVLVANDMTANHYLSRYAGDDRSIWFDESATVRGLAVDAHALPQASMGIACGDFDGDGDLDFYMTGFAQEYNIYYCQTSPGYWKDESAKQGLVTPTLKTVGFGTEAIDLEGDGIDELVITNGHIGDFGPDSPPHAQPMQLFRRNTRGRFDAIDVSAWNDYMAKPHVGRALWTIDVDRDGRRDVVITHENEQPRLLVNRTKSNSRRFALRLVGTRSIRTGVGAVVRFECGGRKRTLWSLAGDGYMCSNEQVMRAAIGDNRTIENLTITWPDGTNDQIGTLELETTTPHEEYLVIQGTGRAFRMSESNR